MPKIQRSINLCWKYFYGIGSWSKAEPDHGRDGVGHEEDEEASLDVSENFDGVEESRRVGGEPEHGQQPEDQQHRRLDVRHGWSLKWFPR